MTRQDDTPTWVPVCAVGLLEPGRGAAALVDGHAVAVFRLAGRPDELRAIDAVDPFAGASVLARGLVGHTIVDGAAVAYVASPLRKQRFDLATGRCLDADAAVRTWPVRISAGQVEVLAQASRSSNASETSP